MQHKEFDVAVIGGGAGVLLRKGNLAAIARGTGECRQRQS
jgi:hypothetical protein